MAAVLLFIVSVLSFALITGTEAYAAGAEPFPFDIYDLSKSEYLMVGTPTDDFEGIGAGRVHGRVTGDGASFRGDFKYYGSEFDPKTKEFYPKREQVLLVELPVFDGFNDRGGFDGMSSTIGHLISGWTRRCYARSGIISEGIPDDMVEPKVASGFD